MAEEFIFKELKDLSERVKSTPAMPGELTNKIEGMLDRLNRMAKIGGYTEAYDTMARYIDLITTIPWGKRTVDNLNLPLTKKLLDDHHYGLEDVKERILQYLSTVILRTRDEKGNISRAPILLFVGLQGIGKTTFAISLAEALGRKFIRISMGGIGSVLELRGRSKAFPEAEPGQIVKALVKSQVMNPLILLDEIEKASGDTGVRMDIMATLLEILDPNQNSSFRDHYVDYPVDLSGVLFICTANGLGTLTAALLDRMEVIKMPSYTDYEKEVIAKEYLLPKVVENSGLHKDELIIDPNLWQSIIRPLGFDSGIRSLNRTLENMTRKVAKEIVEGKHKSVTITEENLKDYLPKGNL
ncbi:MAG: AAA family ATPase [Patescibacteria group bacterium]